MRIPYWRCECYKHTPVQSATVTHPSRINAREHLGKMGTNDGTSIALSQLRAANNIGGSSSGRTRSENSGELSKVGSVMRSPVDASLICILICMYPEDRICSLQYCSNCCYMG